MASNGHQVHRLPLGRIVVEGNRQPIVRVATLTLKDEDEDKHIMQVHVDGSTLAQWDLGKLGERKSTGGEQFFSISEQKMLQFTLPLLEGEGQIFAQGTELKTIQLFILTTQDFQTAVNFLSQNVGMRHCHLKNVLENLMGANAPRHAQSQPLESSGISTMEPLVGPPLGPRGRPLSQTSVLAPARYSPAQFIRRPQTARPRPTLVNADPTQRAPRPGTAVFVRGRIPPQGHRYPPSLPLGPRDPRSFFTSSSYSQPQLHPSRSPSVGDVRERIPPYEHPMRRASMASHALSSRPMQYNGRGTLPSHHQVEIDTGYVPGGRSDDRFDDESANQADQTSSSSRRTISMRASLLEEHPSFRLPPERSASRSPWAAASGAPAPIKIQVLGPPDEPNHSHSLPKILWEFTLHFLPSTKMREICLHAASYIRREYRSTVDGMALVAHTSNGTVFADNDSISEELLHGDPLCLTERRFFGTVQPVPDDLGGSHPDPLHPDWRPEAGKLDGARPASSQDPSSHAIDELDQVPPPRQLPFSMVAPPGPPRSSSPTLAAHSPLIEKPNLKNTSIRTHTKNQLGQPSSQNIRTKAATKKQPSSRQKRPLSAPRREASSASPQTLARRPETSLGILRKRKAPSSDEGISAAIPSVINPTPSGAEAGKQELAKSACMGCRNRKRKCDQLKPACGPCLNNNRPCTYPNIQATKATGTTADEARKGHGLETTTNTMVLRSKTVAFLPVMSDALTQTSHPGEFREIGTQTQKVEHGTMVPATYDAGTDRRNICTDASTETHGCDDIWLPFSQCVQVVVWACNQYEGQIQEAAEIFRATDSSQEDYRIKVMRVAVSAVEFEKELRAKCVEALRR